MVSRMRIAVDMDVLAAQSTTLKRVSDSLHDAETAAGGAMSGSAFGMLASSVILPTVNDLAAQAEQMLAAAHDLASAMQSGLESVRESFEQAETQITSTIDGCEP